MSDLSKRLAAVVGAEHVLTDPDLRIAYERDYSGRYGAESLVVVRPADAQQVAQVVRICHEQAAAVVAQGGNTGLVGAGVPRGGEVLISTTRLNSIGAVDGQTGQLLAGAGATLAEVQKVADAAGFTLPLDLGARDAATIGGLVATDAGGPKALAHGTMRERVAGLSVVLPDGRVIERLGGLLKDNAGYSWVALMIGSEGTLGIITAVLLKLLPRPSHRISALFGVPSVGAAMELLTSLRHAVGSLEAADFFLDSAVEMLIRQGDCARLALGVRAPCYVLVECAATYDPTEELANAIERADSLIIDQAAADDSAGRAALWSVREALPEAINREGIPVKIDTAVPLAKVAELCEAVPGVIEGGYEPLMWGHLGDGNVHVNVIDAAAVAEQVEGVVLELATSLGGTISAEHGVGISKARYLHLARSEEEIAVLRAIKSAIDPSGRFNPGVTLA